MYFVKMLWHRLYADEGTFSFCGAEIGSKSIFERRATIGSGSTFFSFLYTSKLTNLSLLSVFTLIMRHDLPENLGKPLPKNKTVSASGWVRRSIQHSVLFQALLQLPIVTS